MVAEGPTTAGSINAKLTLDSSDFMEKLAAADAAARKLGSVDPSIRVDVDDNGAITKLAAVDAAAQRLDGSNRSLDASLRQVNQTNGQGVQSWQLIAAAIVALIPLLAPLAGYALGVSGALAGMGAAGALAVYGIIQAVKQANSVGIEYKDGLGQLKSALDQLGSTAATSMLGAFRTAVTQINLALPFLNAQIGAFGRVMGNIGVQVLGGVIEALKILNPLFLEASAYVLKLATGFNQWVQGGGLQKFADYARTALPQVADMLGQLAAAVLHIVEAFAPLGTIVVQGLTLLGQAINAIPLPVLLDVGVAAAAGFAAFKLWSVVQPILSSVAAAMGAVGVATQLAAGPIGWVTAGISAMAAVLAVTVTTQQQAAQGAVDFANALQQDNDKIAENVRLTAVKKLHDDGTIAAGHLLGLTTRELTDASTGNAAALADVNSKMAEAQKLLATTGAATGEGTKRQNEQYKALTTVRKGLSEVNSELDQGVTRQQEVKDATSAANDTYAKNADLITQMKNATNAAADATDKLSRDLKGLGQVNLDASQANIQYQQSIADAAATAKQYGQNLDTTTEAGRKNMSALDAIASSAVSLIAAQAKAGASSDQLSSNMGAARQAFINAAEAAGATADQANQLADQYHLIPRDVSTLVHVDGVDAALKRLQDLQAWIDSLHGKTVQIVANVQQAGTVGHLQATGRTGLTAPGLAAGGSPGGTVTGPGNAFTDTAGVFRLANSEEVVSNMYGQASHWRSALKLMNASADPLRVASEVNRLAGARPGGSGPVSVSLAGATIVMSVDGRQMTAVIQDQVVAANRQLGSSIGAGKQKVAY